MHTETLCALFLKYLVCFDYLLVGHTVLCILGGVHYVALFACLEFTAGIVTTADGFGDTCQLVEYIYMSEIIKVNYSAELVSELEILVGSSV